MHSSDALDLMMMFLSMQSKLYRFLNWKNIKLSFVKNVMSN